MKLDTIHLYRFLTHKHRGGWPYLDQEEFVGTATILESHRDVIWDGSGYERSYETGVIMVSGDAPADQIEQGMRDTMSGSRCTHEYDCCGCWSTGFNSIERIEPGFFAYEITGSRNY